MATTTKSRARAKPLPRLSIPVERHTLPNGLRVVLSPDRSSPTVGLALTYDVGFRSEPEGRTGFAHLFEHLMFQGSVNLEKGMYDKLIMGNGGANNGSTSHDYTDYIAQMPSNGLDLLLFLEADRMRGLVLTPEALQNQIDVVKEEIRVNVLNRPYGGFPWIDLPPIMFRTFNNAHNGYGSFVDLEAATAEDAQDFFDRYYAPANAVLVLTGDLDVDDTVRRLEHHFADIGARPAPPVPDCSEPVPDEERRGSKVDPLAPMPALAAAYRVPDPVREVEDYCACVLLAEVLAEGEASRLYHRLVKDDRLVSHLSANVGVFGAFQMRDPTLLQVVAFHPGGTADQVLAAVDEEVERLVGDITQAEVDRACTAWVSAYVRSLDSLVERARTLAPFEQQRDRAELVNELPGLLASVTAADVAAQAERWLRREHRAVLEVVPGAAS